MASEGSLPEWRFSQCFGEKDADQEFSEGECSARTPAGVA